jgi:hypothetical protein
VAISATAGVIRNRLRVIDLTDFGNWDRIYCPSTLKRGVPKGYLYGGRPKGRPNFFTASVTATSPAAGAAASKAAVGVTKNPISRWGEVFEQVICPDARMAASIEITAEIVDCSIFLNGVTKKFFN